MFVTLWQPLDFGGWDPTTGQYDDSLHVLHTVRKEWNRPVIQGTPPTPRHSHTGCSIGTIMYIFGGQYENFYLGDVITFDMKSSKIIREGPAASKAHIPSMSDTLTTAIFSCHFHHVTVTQNARWEIIPAQSDSPPARAGHCAAVYDNKIYIFGGADADYFYNDIWCFDPRTNAWTPIPASGYLPSGRHGHSCTVIDGVFFIFGGNSPDGTDLNDAYAFRINGMYKPQSKPGHRKRWDDGSSSPGVRS